MTLNLEIFKNSNTFENTIYNIWHRNVFFILWYSLVYLTLGLIDLSQNIYNYIKKLWYKKVKHIEYIPNKWLFNKDTIENSFLIFVTLFLVGIAKLIYHIGIITWWICVNIIYPLGKALVILLSVFMIASALSGRKTNNN